MKASSDTQPWYGRSLSRPTLLAGTAAILLVVLLGGLVQAGVLVPVFRSGTPFGGGGNYYSTTIDNVSWRSWVVTASFANGRHTATLSPIGTVRVSLYATGQLAAANVHPVDEVTVGAGGQFGIGITVVRPSCDVAAASPGEVTVGRSVAVPVLLHVATPLGPRTIHESVSAECDVNLPEHGT